MKKEELIKLKSENKGDLVISKLLSFIIGAVDNLDKRLSDSQVESEIDKILMKTYKNNKDLLDGNTEATSYYQDLATENKFLLGHLDIPQQLSEPELKTIIVDVLEKSQGTAKMPDIMKYLSGNYKGRFNGGLANKLANELIKGYGN